MKVSARGFVEKASEFLDAAERGMRIIVTRDGRPVVVLSPVTDVVPEGRAEQARAALPEWNVGEPLALDL